MKNEYMIPRQRYDQSGSACIAVYSKIIKIFYFFLFKFYVSISAFYFHLRTRRKWRRMNNFAGDRAGDGDRSW